MATTELGVEGGVLAVGASSAWTTFGVGLLIGIMADQILNWWLDPVSELSKKLSREFDRLHDLIVEGDGKEMGLCTIAAICQGQSGAATVGCLQNV